jgi:hypothetical protein
MHDADPDRRHESGFCNEIFEEGGANAVWRDIWRQKHSSSSVVAPGAIETAPDPQVKLCYDAAAGVISPLLRRSF